MQHCQTLQETDDFNRVLSTFWLKNVRNYPVFMLHYATFTTFTGESTHLHSVLSTFCTGVARDARHATLTILGHPCSNCKLCSIKSSPFVRKCREMARNHAHLWHLRGETGGFNRVLSTFWWGNSGKYTTFMTFTGKTWQLRGPGEGVLACLVDPENLQNLGKNYHISLFGPILGRLFRNPTIQDIPLIYPRTAACFRNGGESIVDLYETTFGTCFFQALKLSFD